jgi:peroxiredoxin
MPMLIRAGEMAPDFELNDSSGASFRLSDLQGFVNVMLVFYPKDMTSG